MTAIYFLGGLGSNAYHAQDFLDLLDAPVTVLDLPGHGSAFDKIIKTPLDLEDWFQEQIDKTQTITLIGHSLGASLSVHLATRFPQIHQLILLDGGYFDLDALLSLEDELAGTRAYLEKTVYDSLESAVKEEKATCPTWSAAREQAVRESLILQNGQYRLHLNEEAVMGLITLHRAVQGELGQISCPALLLPQTADCPAWKKAMLAQVPQTVQIVKVAGCGHAPHQDRPEEVARIVNRYIK